MQAEPATIASNVDHGNNNNKHVTNDTKNIDDLARQFRESTHSLGFGLNKMGHSNNSPMSTDQFINRSNSCPNQLNNATSFGQSVSSLITTTTTATTTTSANNDVLKQQQQQLKSAVGNNNHIIGIIAGDSDNQNVKLLDPSMVFPITQTISSQPQSHGQQLQQLQQHPQQQPIAINMVSLNNNLNGNANLNNNNNNSDNNNFANNSAFLQNKLKTLNAQITDSEMFISNEMILNTSANNNNNNTGNQSMIQVNNGAVNVSSGVVYINENSQ